MESKISHGNIGKSILKDLLYVVWSEGVNGLFWSDWLSQMGGAMGHGQYRQNVGYVELMSLTDRVLDIKLNSNQIKFELNSNSSSL